VIAIYWGKNERLRHTKLEPNKRMILQLDHHNKFYWKRQLEL